MAKEQVNKEETLVSKIKNMVEDSIGLTSTWELNQLKFHKMRMRIKKAKTFPFVGCANLRMPTLEIKIRKLKAALVNVIFGIRPVVQAIPTPSGTWQVANKIEKFLDHLIMDVIQVKPKAIIGIDQSIEKGFYVFKPYWKTDITTRIEEYSLEDLSTQEALALYSTQTTPDMIGQAIVQKFDIDMHPLVAKNNRTAIESAVKDIHAGKDKISITVEDVIDNNPDVALCPPERVYVATDSGYDPQTAEYIIHEFEMPLETVKLNGKIKGWDLGEIADIENIAESFKDKGKLGTGTDTSKNIDVEKDLREGITRLDKNNKVTIWEYYGWFDINDDGTPEKCVITIAPDFDKVLRKITLPFYSGKYPFVKTYYELTDDRWFSHRGIPELIEDIVKEIDIQHCQKIDQQTIRNTPMYVHRAGMVNKTAMQFIFGQSMPVSGMQSLNDIIAPLNNNNPNVEFSYEREQMMLETKVEELIGQVDFSLQSLINKRQPRTLGEVQLQQQNMNNVFSLDAELFRSSFEELFNWIWDLWCQYGDDQYEFAYFGKNGWERIRLTKEETQGKYKITIRGNDQNTNPQVRLQKAQMVMMAMGNQMAIQMGVITPVNMAEAYKLLFQELDVPNSAGLYQDPQVLMQQMQQKIQQPPPLPVKLQMKQLTDAEQAQVVARAGMQPDIQGRNLVSQAKIQEKQVAQESQKVKDLSDVMAMIRDIQAKQDMKNQVQQWNSMGNQQGG